MRVTFSSCCGRLIKRGSISADFQGLKRNDAAFLRLARRYGGREGNDITLCEHDDRHIKIPAINSTRGSSE